MTTSSLLIHPMPHHQGFLIGGLVGGTVFLFILLVIVFLIYRNRKESDESYPPLLTSVQFFLLFSLLSSSCCRILSPLYICSSQSSAPATVYGSYSHTPQKSKDNVDASSFAYSSGVAYFNAAAEFEKREAAFVKEEERKRRFFDFYREETGGGTRGRPVVLRSRSPAQFSFLRDTCRPTATSLPIRHFVLTWSPLFPLLSCLNDALLTCQNTEQEEYSRPLPNSMFGRVDFSEDSDG